MPSLLVASTDISWTSASDRVPARPVEREGSGGDDRLKST